MIAFDENDYLDMECEEYLGEKEIKKIKFIVVVQYVLQKLTIEIDGVIITILL